MTADIQDDLQALSNAQVDATASGETMDEYVTRIDTAVSCLRMLADRNNTIGNIR
jgi:hypothetical protein